MNKKSRFVVLLFFVSFLSLTACQEAESKQVDTPVPTGIPQDDVLPTPTIAPTTPLIITDDAYADIDPSGQVISFWHPYTSESQVLMDQIASEFNASNAWSITIVPEYQGNHEEIFKKMLTYMNTGDTPNLVMLFQDQAESLQLGSLLLDISPLVNSPQWGFSPQEIADFYPAVFNQDFSPLFNDARLGFGVDRAMDVFYYNADWLAELGYIDPPATPEQFREVVCAAAQQPFSGATAGGQSGLQLPADPSFVTNLVFAFGGEIFDPPTNRYNFEGQAAIEALQFLQRLVNDGCAQINSDARGIFAQGTALVTFGSTDDLPDFQAQVAADANFQLRLAALPQRTSRGGQTLSGASLSITRRTPESELAAWLFIRHLASPEIQTRWAQATGRYPVRLSAVDNFRDQGASALYGSLLATLPSAKTNPSLPEYALVQELTAQTLDDIANGADIESALAQLTTAANDNLRQAVLQIPASPDPWVEVDPSGQIVTFWHPFTGERAAALDEVIRQFNNANKWGLTVIAAYQGDSAELEGKLLAATSGGGDLPALVVTDPSQSSFSEIAPTLTDLTSLINSVAWGLPADQQADFYPEIYQQTRLGLPIYQSTRLLYVNQDWLDELGYASPPTTPDEFGNMACAASQTPFSDSTASTYYGYESSVDAILLLDWSLVFGGDLFDQSRNRYTFDNQGSNAALAFINGLLEGDCIQLVDHTELSGFATGAALFTVGDSSDLATYQRQIEESADFKWSIAPLPHQGRDPQQPIRFVQVSIPKVDPETQLAAWLFLQFLTSPESQATWARITNDLPVRISARTLLANHLATTPDFAAVYDLLAYGHVEPPLPNFDLVSPLIENTLVDILTGANITETLTELTVNANLSE